MPDSVQVSHSLITARTVNDLLGFYDIGEVSECRFLTRGLNDSYLVVSTSGKYIFRIYRSGWRSQSDVGYELDAIRHIHQTAAQSIVSLPVPRSDGQWMCGLAAPEGMRYGVLFRFAEGQTPPMQPEMCNRLGGTLAQIHQAADSFHSESKRSFAIDRNHLLTEPLSAIQPLIERVLGADEWKTLQDAVGKLDEAIPYQQLEFGFCHGDFHDWNMHLDHERLTVFDFDCCSMGYRAYDLAVFWWNARTNYKDQAEPCWSSFLEGYTKERGLAEIDRAAIPYFITARRIWLMGIYINNQDVWGTNWINRANLSKFLQDVKDDEQWRDLH